ncbi:NAD(P)-binding protein [Lizonia empirigonia]|nr:NAD(P)-binding protein [Lizonia empirigonia]
MPHHGFTTQDSYPTIFHHHATSTKSSICAGLQAKQWVLSNPPHADPVLEGDNSTFKLENVTLPEVGADQVLKGMDPERLYVPPVKKGEVMRSYAIGEVVESNVDSLKKGTVANEVRTVAADEKAGIRVTNYIGSLGGPGLTAYYGITDIARATKDDVIVIAKHLIGCKKVIGIAGGDKKCKWVESLGADVCVDYKAASFKEDLKKATEGFVDVYFDNVGSEILDLMLSRIKRFGRVAACGAISTYNDPTAGVKNWFEIIANRIEARGFIVIDAMTSGKAGPMLGAITQGIKDGKIKIDPESETVVSTKFEDIPKTWMTLFSGGNQGKLVTEIKA